MSWRLASAAGLLGGCGPIIVGPSRMTLQEIAVMPPAPLAGKKSARPLYLVLDPDKVPASMNVLVNGAGQGGVMQDTGLFVARDLRRAFGNYFDQVSVAAPTQAPTSGNASIVDGLCVDGSTEKSYDAQGTCNGGLCVYPSHTVTCPNGGTCSGSSCSTDICGSITCDMPPSG